MLIDSLSVKYVFRVENSRDGDVRGIFQTLADFSLCNYRCDRVRLANT